MNTSLSDVRGSSPLDSPDIPQRPPDPAPVIEVRNVSKRYTQNEFRSSLRHEAVNLLRHWLRRQTTPINTGEQFWALKNISFQVYQGESVGIVGHNGAGKSTLFRILCNITIPTSGSVTVNGRFAPLIALGAGFNVELSGRQNIYMSAAIHGLKLREIDAIVPQVIAFSELQDFIDLPVKRYSSGMVARLGFSIAIYTLPDIIFLDEILSVGDAQFQMKCRTRIEEFIEEGRTMLFVSHAAGDVRRLCKRAIWIDHGEVKLDGSANEVIDAYETAMQIPSTRS